MRECLRCETTMVEDLAVNWTSPIIQPWITTLCATHCKQSRCECSMGAILFGVYRRLCGSIFCG